jgi:ketosteroid isomerase-like protein
VPLGGAQQPAARPVPRVVVLEGHLAEARQRIPDVRRVVDRQAALAVRIDVRKGAVRKLRALLRPKGWHGPHDRNPLASGYLASVSQENVVKTSDFIADYNRRDFDAAVRYFDPQIDWVLPPLQRSDSCRGPEEVRRFWEGLDETFDELRLDPQEFVDAGDRVAVRLRFYGRGKGSGAELETEMYHQVTTFRDGIMVRIEYFTDWPSALSAAGVEE